LIDRLIVRVAVAVTFVSTWMVLKFLPIPSFIFKFCARKKSGQT
jgi:hypothetical protein